VLLAGLAALLGVQGVGFLLFRQFYTDVDGALAITQITSSAAWSSIWTTGRISALQGVGAQQLPLNPWINPGYAILIGGPTLPRLLGSYLVFSGCLALGTLQLGAALRLGAVRSLVAAQALCLLVFPPLELVAGLYHQLRLNPGVVFTAAIALLALGLVIRGGTRGTAGNLALLVAPALCFVFCLLCDPIWTVVPYLSLALFFAAALLVEPTRASNRWRGGAALFGVAVLAGLSAPAYLSTLLGYTARAQFRTEIIGEVQEGFYTFLPFESTRAALLFAVLLAGVLAALAAEERRVRIFAAACLAHMALLTGMSLVYLYTDVNWTYPLPVYLQLPALPVYLLVALAGWHALLPRVRDRAPFLRGRLPPAARTPLAAVLALPVVGLALIAIVAARERLPLSNLWDPATAFSGGLKLGPPYLDLAKDLAVPPGEPFRGSVAVVYPDEDVSNARWVFARLAAMGIPTFEEYSQLVSPQQFYLVSRALARPGDSPFPRNRVRVTVPRPGLLRSLGVKYLSEVSALPDSAPGARAADGKKRYAHRVTALGEPNRGTYSPVRVVVARSARETVDLLVSPGMDFERDVVLTEPLAGPLVPARDAAARFVDGKLCVAARSEGRSVLLLPLQYSHALAARATRGAPRLVRANLTQTGLVFEREVDACIALRVGFRQTAGREQDLADLALLGIGEDGTRSVPPAVHERLHPSAKFRL
jgi:hypothetical protein